MWKLLLAFIALCSMIPAAFAESSALIQGDIARDGQLTTIDAKQVSISSYWQEAPAVIVFYRGGWCPICNRHLRELQEALPQIRAAGGDLIAISPELPTHAQLTMLNNKLDFTVLTDEGNKLAENYGLLWTVPADKQEGFSTWLQESKGKSLKDYNGQEGYTLPIPATYVVNTDGQIVYSFVDTDYTKRAKSEDIIKALEALAAENH